MLRSSARNFLAKETPLTFVRSLEQKTDAYPAELWKKIADLGWPSLPIAGQYGGSEGTFLDVAVLLDEMGRALFPGPYLFSTLCVLLIQEFGSDKTKGKYLPLIADGKAIFTLAWTEKTGEYTDHLETTAEEGANGATITGHKMFVPCGSYATHYLVAAKTKSGIGIYVVSREQATVSTKPLSTTGWDNQANVDFKKTHVSKDDVFSTDGATVLERAVQLGAAMQCVVMSGMAQRATEITGDYAKIRVQFGRPIGSFQAVQHHLANMAVDTDISRNMAYRVAERITNGEDVRFDASAAKAFCGPACMRVMKTGHQVHGGIGVINDHAMQMFFLRMKPLEMLLGDCDFHTHRISDRLMDLVK